MRLTIISDNSIMNTVLRNAQKVQIISSWVFRSYPLFDQFTNQLSGWMKQYVSRIQDIESVFHISELQFVESCFFNEQKETTTTLSFCKALIFAFHTARQKNSPIMISSATTQYGDHKINTYPCYIHSEILHDYLQRTQEMPLLDASCSVNLNLILLFILSF